MITRSPSPGMPSLPHPCWAWPSGLLWPMGWDGSDRVPFRSPGLKGHGMSSPAPRGKHALDGCCLFIPDPRTSNLLPTQWPGPAHQSSHSPSVWRERTCRGRLLSWELGAAFAAFCGKK